MTILPITGAVEDVVRVTDAAVDGFIVWTTSDDDPVVAAVRSRGARPWCTAVRPFLDWSW